MFGAFDFIYNTCKFFIKKGESPSFELTIALYQLLKTPEFEADLKYISDTNPEKVAEFIKLLRKALKEMEDK